MKLNNKYKKIPMITAFCFSVSVTLEVVILKNDISPESFHGNVPAFPIPQFIVAAAITAYERIFVEIDIFKKVRWSKTVQRRNSNCTKMVKMNLCFHYLALSQFEQLLFRQNGFKF